MKRKVCFVTGSRAEYGMLYWLLKEIDDDPKLELQIVVTGMHLSPEFGLTYKEVVSDGFKIDQKVEILLSSDTPVGISKSMGLGMISLSECFERIKPDIVVGMGDRFELFAAVSAAMIGRIPVAHLSGGELTEGAIDEAIRHSISKMSHLHFVATEEYRKRVIQLGESPDTVFHVGEVGLDNIRKLKLLTQKQLEKDLGLKFNKRNYLVTYHPVTLEEGTTEEQFKNLLNALDTLEDTNLIFTKPNADTGGRIIMDMIDDYSSKHSDKAFSFTSLGRLRYLSTCQYVDGVIGNSSSGLVEVPSFKIGTINIGDRQKGRLKPYSVIDCEPQTESILKAIKKLQSTKFQSKLKAVENPYGDGRSAKRIKNIIKKSNLDHILKKKFHDVKWK